MNKPNSKIVKIVVIMLMVALVLSLITYQWTTASFQGAQENLPFYVGAPQPYSYIIDTNSTHYFAFNGTTDFLEQTSTTVSPVILSTVGDNRTVFFKAGRYPIDSDVLITSRDFTIDGEGADAVTFVIGVNGGFTFTRSASATFRDNNMVRNVGFDGQGVALYAVRSRSNASGNVILGNFEISNSRFVNFNAVGAHALDLVGLEQARIINSIFGTGTKASQIYLWEDGTYEAGNILVANNLIVTTDNTANGAIGIHVNCTGTDIDDSGVGAVTVLNNHFLGDTKLSVGVQINCETKTSTKNAIIHNRAEGCDLVHFYDLNASCYSKYTEVADNLIVSSYGSECNIKLGLYSAMIQVHDNVISNQNSSSYFIQDWGNASSTQWNSVYDNAFTGTAKFGMGIYTEVRNNMGLNPLGVQSGNFRSDSSISFHGTYSNWGNGTTYRLVTTNMFLSVSGGTGVNITITDPKGVLFKADLPSDDVYLIPWRYKFSITYDTLPTVVFAWT